MTVLNLDEIRQWARESGAIAKHYFNSVLVWRKADNSPVTQADLEIERFLRERISARYPDHGIMGEEEGVGHTEREFVWVLDPLDGTAAFVAGLPIWGTSIGVFRNGKPFAGVIYLPLTDECYWSMAGAGAFLNDQPIRARTEDSFDRNDWIAGPSKAHLHYDITFPGKIRSLGSVASYFCYVARGTAVGALLGRPRLWDVAAGMAILQEAGGVTAGLSGQPLDLEPMLQGHPCSEPIVLAAHNLLPQLLESIRLRRKP